MRSSSLIKVRKAEINTLSLSPVVTSPFGEELVQRLGRSARSLDSYIREERESEIVVGDAKLPSPVTL